MPHVLYMLGLLATLGAALAAIPRIWQAAKWMYRLLKRVDEFSHLGPVIVGMAQQFQRNGGSSMKDAVVALKDDVSGVKKDVADLKTQTNAQDEVLGQLVKDVKRLMGDRTWATERERPNVSDRT